MAKTKKTKPIEVAKPKETTSSTSDIVVVGVSGDMVDEDDKKIASAVTLSLEKSEQRKVSKQAKKLMKGLDSGALTLKSDRKLLKQKAEEKRGLIYIGHIPHGFFEDEMKKYFKQFGRVTNLKVCRSNKTGRSKGYGYIEFEHPEVAKIAAESMNNYLMFKKRIVTKFVPYEERPPHLFHGRSSDEKNTSVKNRRGKQKYSRNKPKDEATIEKKNKITLNKLQTKLEKLKSRGIQCSLTPVGIDETKIKLEKTSSSRITRAKSSQGAYLQPFSVPSNLHLSKSLDSVQKLLNKKSSQNSETQTVKAKEKKLKQGGVSKVKKEKVKKQPIALSKLDKNAIKTIARDLVRKQGSPLMKLKSKGRGAKKTTKK